MAAEHDLPRILVAQDAGGPAAPAVPWETEEAFLERLAAGPEQGPRAEARMIWIRNRTRWQSATATADPVSGQLVSPICERPSHLGGPWGVGCSDCAKHSKLRCTFARFESRTAHSMQRCVFMAHIKSPTHRAAATAASRALVQDLQPQVEGVTVGQLSGQVPRPEKFVHAVVSCHAGTSYADFGRFCELHDLCSSMASVGVQRDESAAAVKKMIWSVSNVKIREDQAFLKKSVRFSFAQDPISQKRYFSIIENLQRQRGHFCRIIHREHPFAASKLITEPGYRTR